MRTLFYSCRHIGRDCCINACCPENSDRTSITYSNAYIVVIVDKTITYDKDGDTEENIEPYTIIDNDEDG